MRIAKEEMDVPVDVPGYKAFWGELGNEHISFETCGPGFDIDAAMSIFPNGKCPIEHSGYIFKGSILINYADGTQETLRAGDAYHLAPGHAPIFLEETSFIEWTNKADHDRQVMQVKEAGVWFDSTPPPAGLAL